MQRDARSLPPETQAELRRLALEWTRAGRKQASVAELLGVSEKTVSRWVRHAASGAATQSRGRRPGHGALNEEASATIRAAIV